MDLEVRFRSPLACGADPFRAATPREDPVCRPPLRAVRLNCAPPSGRRGDRARPRKRPAFSGGRRAPVPIRRGRCDPAPIRRPSSGFDCRLAVIQGPGLSRMPSSGALGPRWRSPGLESPSSSVGSLELFLKIKKMQISISQCHFLHFIVKIIKN